MRLLGGPLTVRLASPFPVRPYTTAKNLDHLLTECGVVPDGVLGVHPHSENQPNELWLVAPAKTVALTADRQVVVRLSTSTELPGNHVVSLPAPACAIATDVAGATCLRPDLL